MKREPSGKIPSIISLALFCLIAPAVWWALLWVALNWPVSLFWWLLLVGWSFGILVGLLVAIGDVYAAWFVRAGHKTGKAGAVAKQGLADREHGYASVAEERLKEAPTAVQERGDSLDTAKRLRELGNVYAAQGDVQAAEDHYMRALLLYQEIGDKYGAGLCFSKLGLIHRERGDLERAEEYLGKALAMKEEMGDGRQVATAFANLGLVYADRGDLERAEEHFKKALAIFEEMGDMSGVAEVRETLGRLEIRRRREP